MSTRPDAEPGVRHRSIREVLELLAVEFPDVTVSKIRFLESRGLIHPQRTASGYRKFADDDVERLRWILRQQRENFLPLKVIKGRLEQGAVESLSPSLFDSEFADDPDGDAFESSAPHNPSTGGFVPEVDWDSDASLANSLDDPSVDADDPSAPEASEPVAADPDPVPRRRRAQRAAARPGSVDPMPDRLKKLSADELAKAASTDVRLVGELDEFGICGGEGEGEDRRYLEAAVEIVRIAAALRAYGIEARHLRTFKHAAERDAGVFAQVIAPMLQQRNPEARRRARGELAEIVQLGAAAHQAFVSAALDALGKE